MEILPDILKELYSREPSMPGYHEEDAVAANQEGWVEFDDGDEGAAAGTTVSGAIQPADFHSLARAEIFARQEQ